MSVASSVYLRRILVTLFPFNAQRDQLKVGDQVQVDVRSGDVRLDAASGVDIVARPVQQITLHGQPAGVLELVAPGSYEEKTASDWDRILNSPVYRLNLAVSVPYYGLLCTLLRPFFILVWRLW